MKATDYLSARIVIAALAGCDKQAYAVPPAKQAAQATPTAQQPQLTGPLVGQEAAANLLKRFTITNSNGSDKVFSPRK